MKNTAKKCEISNFSICLSRIITILLIENDGKKMEKMNDFGSFFSQIDTITTIIIPFIGTA